MCVCVCTVWVPWSCLHRYAVHSTNEFNANRDIGFQFLKNICHLTVFALRLLMDFLNSLPNTLVCKKLLRGFLNTTTAPPRTANVLRDAVRRSSLRLYPMCRGLIIRKPQFFCTAPQINTIHHTKMRLGKEHVNAHRWYLCMYTLRGNVVLAGFMQFIICIRALSIKRIIERGSASTQCSIEIERKYNRKKSVDETTYTCDLRHPAFHSLQAHDIPFWTHVAADHVFLVNHSWKKGRKQTFIWRIEKTKIIV